MTIARDERIKLELGAQAVWQFPTISRERVQPVVHVSRPLSDQLLRVDRSAVVLDFQHITAILHTNVCSQLAHDRDWCQRRNELVSSSCRHGLLEHQESHHSIHTHDSSREIQNLHDLGCADSTTRRNHVGRGLQHGTARSLSLSLSHSNMCTQLTHECNWCQMCDDLSFPVRGHCHFEHQEMHRTVHTDDSSKQIQNSSYPGRPDSAAGGDHVARCHIHWHQTVTFTKSFTPPLSSCGSHHKLLCSSVRQTTGWSQKQLEACDSSSTLDVSQSASYRCRF